MTGGDPIPSAALPIAARAPGKCVLFGEHAIVFGAPALVMAIDLDVQVGVRGASATALNGDPTAGDRNPYFRAALAHGWTAGPPIEVTSTGRLPRSAGLGSSAAFTAALTAALGAARGGLSRADLGQAAYEVERGAQGVGSPGDTSAVVAGGYITLNHPGPATLWTATDGRRSWEIRRVEDPSWVWLVANSGIARGTAEVVRKVGETLGGPGGPAILDRFAGIARRGIAALRSEDRASVGSALSENQDLLREIGVSHPKLEEMLGAVAPSVEGAKLTGAGAGGSIVALPRLGREAEAARRLQRIGATAYVVTVPKAGVHLVEPR